MAERVEILIDEKIGKYDVIVDGNKLRGLRSLELEVKPCEFPHIKLDLYIMSESGKMSIQGTEVKE